MVHFTKISGEQNYSPLWVFSSTCFFFFANLLMYKITPLSAKISKLQGWEWRNTATSLLHASITGVWSLLCLSEEPKLSDDFFNEYSRSAHMLISFCIGYFIYDTIDMCVNHMGRATVELLGHHICVIAAFSIPAVHYKFLGLTVTGILVEVNSVFLHIRHLLQLQGVGSKTSLYYINSFLNVATFVVFRLAVLTYSILWIQSNMHNLPLSFYGVGIILLLVVTVMNYVLFYRVVAHDFFKTKEIKTLD